MNELRTYGHGPYTVAVLHGGPGAGEMEPVARAISDEYGVLEPFQTALSVNGLIEELYLILQRHGQAPVTLVGYSWGACLGLLFAAAYPEWVRKLILVSSAPLEDKYAGVVRETQWNRMSKQERQTLSDLKSKLADTDIRERNGIIQQYGALLAQAEPLMLPLQDQAAKTDTFDRIWAEARQLRASGRLADAGRKLKCPVSVIHGEYDPQPYEGVIEPLRQRSADVRFFLLRQCGHTPWAERRAADAFYTVLRNELKL